MRKKNLRNVMRFLICVVVVAFTCAFGANAALAASAENGKKAFVAHGCWQCHGFEGQGSVATSNGTVIARTGPKHRPGFSPHAPAVCSALRRNTSLSDRSPRQIFPNRAHDLAAPNATNEANPTTRTTIDSK